MEHVRDDVNRNWKDYGAVILCCYAAEGLKVAQLKIKRNLDF